MEMTRRRYPQALRCGGRDAGRRLTTRRGLPRRKEAPQAEKSAAASARGAGFASTTPGLVTRSTARPEGVQLDRARIEGVGEDDAAVCRSSHACCTECVVHWRLVWQQEKQFSEATGLSELKKENLAGRVTELRAGKNLAESELAAEALVTLVSPSPMRRPYLLAAHASEDIRRDWRGRGGTDRQRPSRALHGALWELDQDIATLFADDDAPSWLQPS